MKKILVFSLALASMFSSCKKETEYIQIEIHDTIKNKIEVFLNQPNAPDYASDSKDLAKKQIEPALYDKATNSATVNYSNGAVATFEGIDFDKNEAILVKLKFEEKTLSKATSNEQEVNLMSSFYIVKDQKVNWIKVKKIGNGKEQTIDFPNKKISVTIPNNYIQIKAQALKNAKLVTLLSELNIEKDAFDQSTIVEIPYSMYDKYLSAKAGSDKDFEYVWDKMRIRWDAALIVGWDYYNWNLDNIFTPSDYFDNLEFWEGDDVYYSIRGFVGDYSKKILSKVNNRDDEYKIYPELVFADVISTDDEIAQAVYFSEDKGNYSKGWYLHVKKAGSITVTADVEYDGLIYHLSRNVSIYNAAK